MNLISFSFLGFCIILLLLYFIVPKKIQWIVLLIANIVFYAFAGIKLLIFILFTTITTYIISILIQSINKRQKTKRKLLCALVLVSNFGIWGFLKYTNFIIGSFTTIQLSLLLPLGISFYTFIAMGYVIDIYRGKYLVEKNIFKFALFLTYFPHIIQGPFSRFDKLSPTLFAVKSFSYTRLCEGLRRILWGLFKKLIVADKLAIPVSEFFNNYTNYSGIYILFAGFLYAIQIYADFSGYMDIACGVSKILGIELSENFAQPYFSVSIEDFWRRWHITLGAWFRDYMFYPISMSKMAQKIGSFFRKRLGPKAGKLIPGYFALVFVWISTGLWHGARWGFIAWGILNLLIILSGLQFANTYSKIKDKLGIKSDSFYWKIFQILRTLFLVSLLRIFARSPSFMMSLSMYKSLFRDFSFDKSFLPNITSQTIAIVILGVLMILIVDILSYNKQWERIKEKCPFIIRNIVYATLIFIMILFAGENINLLGGFIYAKF